ncbi:unnamed protein product [Candida verbasci]|uniref:RlpA-like protein double-psi beta-barrel domain-containing protein n=1 Tax=Candida verbasci TaxID=1227364 RepID=A0A9W4XHV0_9ASCO|nr:unnamed protein product [Candida verbasci]
MKFTTILLSSLLTTFINAAPALVETVIITAYTTVVVDQDGIHYTPTQTATLLADASQTYSILPTSEAISLVTPSQTEIQQSQTPSTSSSIPSSSSQPSGSVKSGEGTYYDVSVGATACGTYHANSEYIVALSKDLYDENNIDGNPNNNPLCGKKIKAFYQGKSVEVTVVDRCEGCAYNDLDFSPSAFSQLADQGLGRIDITWQWA